ncbi:unnamed protein product [Dracunculus medinensis]|uniref:Bulb-type lectin domain-containing protein n=1 Tax=Dracunculus medinensis TaxID=318479 RepID=A0A0N4U9C4_DRAME|nr:unnamed protein product [Dracunculus medinensis]
MDGKITAIDVNNNGNIVWSSDLDGVPLLSGTLHSYQVSSQKPSYVVVPSLDGSLYAFDTSDNALNPIPVSAGKSVMVGNDALAGGTILSSTGIDPATGQIRYHCSPDNCEQKNALSGSLYTLLVQRSTQIIRAADPFSGLERWNTSVGDYTISLASNNAFDHHSKEQKSSNIRFLLRPPDGVITALDSCGYPFWRHDFKNPIAKTWQLLYGKISEVFFFQLLFSILFLFLNIFRNFIIFIIILFSGTVNSEPYLIFSDKMRGELRRNEESSYKQIASNSAKHSLYLPDFSVSEF